MAAIAIHIHPLTNIKWAPFTELAGDGVSVASQPPENGGAPEEPMGLRFTDPDGEMHVYLFSSEGKQELLRQMTSGVIVP